MYFSRYGAGFFHCRLPDKRVPVTVAVTTHPNVTAVNQLPVRSQEVNPSDRKQFAVCVSPLFGGYNSTTDIIQWIELNRILGADLFVFYNFSTGKNVGKLLEFYSGKNLVKVIPWDVSKFRPPGKKHELNYAGQTVALNDCLMRVKPIFEFVVNIDLDELIVPHGGLTTWWDIVNKNPDVAVYNFRSSFFRLNWDNFDKDFPRKDVAEKHKLSFLLKLDREVKIFPPNDRTKYFAKTDVADSLGVHKVFALTSPHKSEMFPPEVALVHHYRTIYATINGVSQPDYVNKGPKVFDDSVLKLYGDRLIDNVLKIRNELNQ